MPVIESKLDPRDATFAKNRDAMAALVADLKAKVAHVEQCAAAAVALPLSPDEIAEIDRILGG